MKVIPAILCLLLFSPSLARADENDFEEIIGTVTTSSGTPVPGATVRLYELTRDVVDFAVRLSASTVTDEKGRYLLRRPFEEAGPRTISVSVVVASRDGLAIDWAMLGERGDEVTLVLGKPAALAGRVVDHSGESVRGADVRALLVKGPRRAQQFFFGLEPVSELVSTTNEEGRFRFTNLSEEEEAALLVTAPGMAPFTSYRPGAASVPHKAGDMNIAVTLSPESTAEGVVVEKESDKPVAGVRVLVGPTGVVWKPFISRTVVSDENGRFRATGLGAGKWTIRLLPGPSPPDEWVAEPVEVTVAGGETVGGFVVGLQKGGLLEISVTDELTGAPAARVGVLLEDAVGWPASVVTAGDGKGILRLLPGRYRLKYATGPECPHTPFSEQVRVRAGEVTRAPLSVKGSLKVSGVALDAAGSPVQGAQVCICPLGRRPSATTDAEGRFDTSYNVEERGYTPPRHYVVARHVKRNLAAAVELQPSEGPLVVTLKRAVTVRGRLVDEGGNGVRDAAVTVMFKGRGERVGAAIVGPGAADSEGRWEMRAVPAGFTYEIYVEAEGYGPTQKDFSLKADADEVTELADTVIRSAAP
ncbi:MAG: hypothetical protein ACYTAN_09585 [Planctomycetota bacterium]